MTVSTVAVIAFDRISSFQLSLPCFVFSGVRMPTDPCLFNLRISAAEPGPLHSSDGFVISADCNLHDLETSDIIIVPTWRDPDETPPEALLNSLRTAHQRGALVVGLCLGTYVLAAAGLLEGRPASTHWMWADDLAQRYPSIQVKSDVLYVDNVDIITSAGVAAGIDCCLHIIRRFHGAEAAARVARQMVVPPHRQGGQAQYIEHAVTVSTTPDLFSRTLEWLQAHLDQPHSIDSLAARAMMSRRTFTRRMRQVTGTTVGTWLLNQRLMLAQRLLETTMLSLGTIAGRAGFGAEASLRHHFRRAFNTTPGRFRKEFRCEAGN